MPSSLLEDNLLRAFKLKVLLLQRFIALVVHAVMPLLPLEIQDNVHPELALHHFIERLLESRYK